MKRFYGRTNKNGFEKQITKHEHRQARLRALNQIPHSVEQNTIPDDLLDKDDLSFTDPEEHHHMSQSKLLALNLFMWIQAKKGDPAVDVCSMLLHFTLANMWSNQGFYHKVMSHLIGRLLLDDLHIEPIDRAQFLLLNNCIYAHKALCINFTTYDNWRNQDTIKPRTHSNIMMLSCNNTHPYCYAHVLAVFHAMVQLNSSWSQNRELHRTEFLWVRWYNINEKAHVGFKAHRQFQLKFHTGTQAFGFVNPADDLCAVHLISNFQKSTTTCFLESSSARHDNENNEDYYRYYVNMWVIC